MCPCVEGAHPGAERGLGREISVREPGSIGRDPGDRRRHVGPEGALDSVTGLAVGVIAPGQVRALQVREGALAWR
jgi:hypothetical protein